MNHYTKLSATIVSLSVALAGCGGDDDDNESAPGLSYPAHVRPLYAQTQYACGAPGAITQEVLADLNAFWQSSARACACQLDTASFCAGGAFVAVDPGTIYYDATALTRLDQISNSRLPADMVMAHEFGHSIQAWLGLPGAGKFKELQADCLAGYYIGSRIRRGLANQSDVAVAFATACSYGDPYLAPWFEPGAHGVCQERVAKVNQGIQGNLVGHAPGQACPI